MSTVRLLLASSSPRRREILAALGLRFEVRPSEVDERLGDGEDAYEAAERLAREKATAVAARANTASGTIVIAADTLVVLDGSALGKPRDPADAEAMLRRLSGRRHDAVTGLAVARDREIVSGREITGVTFAPLTEEEIRWYVATGEPADRAGAYAIQSIGGLFVEKIDGSPSNVVGLPVRLLYRLLGPWAAQAGFFPLPGA